MTPPFDLTPSNPFVVGEIPDPVEYQFQQANGTPLPVGGFQARFTVRERWSTTPAEYAAQVTDGPAGKVTYTWTGSEFPTPGRYLAELWVGNTPGGSRFASVLLSFTARAPVGAVPAI